MYPHPQPDPIRIHRPRSNITSASPPSIHKLAFEVLGLIFEAIVDSPSDEVNPRTWPEQKGLHIPYIWFNDLAPITLSAVCRRWKHVVHRSPRLWRYIRLNPERPVQIELERIAAYVARSGVVGLHLFYESSGGKASHTPVSHDILSLLQITTRRWVTFQGRFDGPRHLHRLVPLLREGSSLDTLFLTQLPIQGHSYPLESTNAELPLTHPLASNNVEIFPWRLENLRRFALNDLEPSSFTSTEALHHLLSYTPRLEQLWVSSVDHTTFRPSRGTHSPVVQLPRLSQLDLHPSAIMNCLTPEIFELVKVPSLTALRINLLDYLPLPESIDLLTRFLRCHAGAVVNGRAASITKLSLIAARGDSEILTIMSMLPSVEHVIIWGSVLEATAQLCYSFGRPLELPEFLQMNPHLDDDWEFDEMLRIEEEERGKRSLAVATHKAATCMECREPDLLDSRRCPPAASQVRLKNHPDVQEDLEGAVVYRPQQPSLDRQEIGSCDASSIYCTKWGNQSAELQSFIGLKRHTAIDRYTAALATGSPFNGWLLPNLRSIHFRTTKFYRGENALLLLQMFRQRQDASAGVRGSILSEGVMPPAGLESLCLKDIRLCRVCRPRFRRIRDAAGCAQDREVARSLCGYAMRELDDMIFEVDTFFEECRTACSVANGMGPCALCP